MAEVVLLRHAETEWSKAGKHTGRTDIPLTTVGEAQARRLGTRLRTFPFAHVLSSPQRRALVTCELAGFGGVARVNEDLSEWDCGEYEGLTLEEIHASRPGWQLFRDGCPGGESPLQVSVRADRIVSRVRTVDGNVALFSHGHILRVLAARWINLSASYGENFLLDTATLNVLGYYRESPAFKIWNAPLHN